MIISHLIFTLSTRRSNVGNLNTFAVIAGKLSPPAMGLVMEWATQHQSELQDVWDQARNMAPLDKIDPLP